MTTNFIDHKIGTKVSREFQRAVTGKTDIVTMASGRERGNAAWKHKKMEYTANYAMLSEESQREVLTAFYACNAMLYLFRFRDAGDYRVVNSPFDTSTAVGTTDPVQLTNRYVFGPAHADRMIQAVVTCTVRDNTSAVVTGTVDTSLGLFTPDSAWGSGVYTWSGVFDVWVRFNSDKLNVTLKTIDVATADIELIEQIAYDSSIEGS